MRPRIPVLLYHAVMDDPPPWIAEFTVTPREFARQLDAVVASGRTAVPLSALARHLAGKGGLPPRPVVLTFDDGFADLPGPTAEALAARDLPATAYLTTGAITPGRASLLPPAPMMDLAEAPLLEQYGMEVGAHTVTHPQLDTLNPRELRRELRDCKAVLEDVLNHEVAHLAYPHGYNSPAVRRAARDTGYASAVAVRHALSSDADDAYRIARLIVRRTHTVADVEGWMAGRGARTAPYPDSPATVGWRLYRRTRALVRGRAEFAG
ncbi:polysaccharide deacetylase family protein [Streptomyces sp. WAC05374]|uniref:polysaccharide deacetylase family protein n=1 Tax=Streptomyces sp. WAC05374 TaxID=2487420 RepID=UPI000F865118|nr:polysaccharide deacetylase family protein [Streptomyces sp. WAC05374]RST04017.1 polysaccharide deacetylase family protein [Streptomyces sp. WAC05374]TDF46972.1 polysaccharide deacetylase family protein [Streptomyces sp. WAC05374]TDF57227.1 polysaccharide deacetylase family protein [Streptomyces sp. WAC05374]TDF61330.1 polysaccharide deacetylase family protein [Streptomyces sp. WAC05374]